MQKNTQNDIKTLAYVLRRTNYAEADRILNLITPDGKKVAIARGARRGKSKLAGGVEMFSLIELNIHFGKGEMGVVTASRMLKYYDKILADFERMEFAAQVLKKISLAAEGSDNSDFFQITQQVLEALNAGEKMDLIEAWFSMNYAKAMGEQINLYYDARGEKLVETAKYEWEPLEGALVKKETGMIDANTIKLIRLMLVADLKILGRVKVEKYQLGEALFIARSVNKI